MVNPASHTKFLTLPERFMRDRNSGGQPQDRPNA